MNLKVELLKTYRNILKVFMDKVYTTDEIKISDRSIGATVEMVQPDGTLAPIADGEYVMEDGFTFTTKDGVIESIAGEAPAEAPSEEVKAEDVPTDAPTEEAPADGPSMEDRVATLESKVDSILEILKAMAENQMKSQEAFEAIESNVTSITTEFNALKKTPVESTKLKKSNEVTKEEKLFGVAQMIGQAIK